MRLEKELPQGAPGIVRNPVKYMEWVIAIAMVITGLYIAGPFYLPTATGQTSTIAQTITTHIGLSIFGFLYASPGFILSWGLWKDSRKWRATGLFWGALILTFTVFLALLVQGFRPINWLFPLVCGLIQAIIWLRIRWESRAIESGHSDGRY